MRLIRFRDQGTPGGVPTITREMEIQPGLVSQIGRPGSSRLPMSQDYQNDRIRETRLSSNLAFAAICELWGLSRSSGSILPNPRSISQTKAPLEKLSPRASRNQYSQSIPQATATTPCQHPTLSPSTSTTEPFPLHCRQPSRSAMGGPPPPQCSFFPHSDTRASSRSATKNKMLF